jgi:hypothetical protein
MLRWADKSGRSVGELAEASGSSEWHLRNIFAGRRQASLGLAKRLSDISGGTVPMEAFLKPEGARA